MREYGRPKITDQTWSKRVSYKLREFDLGTRFQFTLSMRYAHKIANTPSSLREHGLVFK